jgi:hypothetical protein
MKSLVTGVLTRHWQDKAGVGLTATVVHFVRGVPFPDAESAGLGAVSARCSLVQGDAFKQRLFHVWDIETDGKEPYRDVVACSYVGEAAQFDVGVRGILARLSSSAEVVKGPRPAAVG